MTKTQIVSILLAITILVILLMAGFRSVKKIEPLPLPDQPSPAPINIKEPQKPLTKDTSSSSEKPKQKAGEVVGSDITYNNILNGVNQERYNAGIDILQSNSELDKVANDKLQDMLKYNYWSHTNPTTGATFYSWFDKEFYSYKYAGENLARDYNTVQETVRAWMDSPTHKENMLKEQYTQTGIAISGSLVVQLFSD